MKIALTGSSSTGKTTLINELLRDSRFNERINHFIKVDGRTLLQSIGCEFMDEMSREQLEHFQIMYFKAKVKNETGKDDFITDRSFTDIAAYWSIRDAFDKTAGEKDRLLVPCRELAANYDITFYLPFGLVPFQADGYRSESISFHKQIDEQIRFYLKYWHIRHVKLTSTELQERVSAVLSWLSLKAPSDG